MTVLYYPSACYGLGLADEAPRIGKDYHVLHASPGFSPEATAELKKMARNLEWRSDGKPGTFPPSFVLWPLPEEAGILAARLRDAGRDDQGRPHSFRIEAAYIADRGVLDDPTILAGILHDRAWPAAEWDWKTAPKIALQPDVHDDSVRREIAAALQKREPCPRLLVGGKYLNFDREEYDAVLPRDPIGSKAGSLQIPASESPSGECKPVDMVKSGYVVSMRAFMLVVVLAGLLIIGLIEERREKRNALREAHNLSKRIQKLEERGNPQDTKIVELEKIVDSYQKAFNEIRNAIHSVDNYR